MKVKTLLCLCIFSTVIGKHNPNMFISQPIDKRLDQNIHIRIENLNSYEEIELQAQTQDARNITWFSKAKFKANKRGFVDLSSCQPIKESSYIEVDEMGLFWSMLPTSGNPFSSYKCKDDQISTDIKLFVSGKKITNQTILRYVKSPDIKQKNIRENNLVGTLFIPPSNKPLPLIITLSGSNGGLSENRAKLLASNSFAVLALAYFGIENLPITLQKIPLEYFETAFHWIKKQSSIIDSSRVGLYGVSRGAELSLLLGSVFPDSILAIVAVSPSSVVYSAIDNPNTDAWIYHNKQLLPYALVPEITCSDEMGKKAVKFPLTLTKIF